MNRTTVKRATDANAGTHERGLIAPAPLRLWPRLALIGLVHAYRWTLKPWLGNACRFEPSCSAYALQALGRHGALRGTALSGWRLARCHPWCPGGLDVVPEHWPAQPLRGHFVDLFKKSQAPRLR